RDEDTLKNLARIVDGKDEDLVETVSRRLRTLKLFQLILPELSDTEDGQLYLLLALCFLSPLLSWASDLRKQVQRSTAEGESQPRRSLISFFLAAPAMFVWGAGTSTVGEDSLDWGETVS
ncbi:unnamed protein product, partial [Sphacelaria rigidula]